MYTFKVLYQGLSLPLPLLVSLPLYPANLEKVFSTVWSYPQNSPPRTTHQGNQCSLTDNWPKEGA